MSTDACRDARNDGGSVHSSRFRFIRGPAKRLVLGTALLALLAGPAAAITVEERPALAEIIDVMVERHGFERARLERLFAQARLRPEVIEFMQRPREALPWHQYRRSFLTEERVTLGVRFWEEHRRTLARAELAFGVPAELIVAILGVETRYGTYRGSHAVLDALLTLALDYPPRADFFRRELEEFLLLARELELDPAALQGSYAGALGIPQFIASSYRQYAVDFDGDGRRDLLESMEDAIGSVGNFLRRHGWTAGQPVIEPARLTPRARGAALPESLRPSLALSEWIERGVVPVRGVPEPGSPQAERAAALVVFEGERAPLHHLGYGNFYVITRYNRSQNYAMAVYELARMIRNRYHGAS
jgi:membrane-bound lytic murein transglycosylase B